MATADFNENTTFEMREVLRYVVDEAARKTQYIDNFLSR
jgi:hypothetical protein